MISTDDESGTMGRHAGLFNRSGMGEGCTIGWDKSTGGPLLLGRCWFPSSGP